MNELSSTLMISAGREIITTVITSHWLRINIDKTNFAELMMVNSMKMKLTEHRIGRIVVQVLSTLFIEEAINPCFCKSEFVSCNLAKFPFIFSPC